MQGSETITRVQARFLDGAPQILEGQVNDQAELRVMWEGRLLVFFQAKSEKASLALLQANLPPDCSIDQFLVTQTQTAQGRFLALIHESDLQPLLLWCKNQHISSGCLWALNQPIHDKEVQITAFAHWLLQCNGSQLTRLTPFHPEAPLEPTDHLAIREPDFREPALFEWPLLALSEEAERRRNQRFVKKAFVWVLTLLVLLGGISIGLQTWAEQKSAALEENHAVYLVHAQKKEREIAQLNDLLGELQKYSQKRERSGELANLLRHIFNLCPPSTLLEDWEVSWDIQGWHMRGSGFTQNETLPSQWAGTIETELPHFHSTISEVKRGTNLPQNMLYRFNIELEPQP